jgi:hypothetical protein
MDILNLIKIYLLFKMCTALIKKNCFALKKIEYISYYNIKIIINNI